jgi:hypothetical protein
MSSHHAAVMAKRHNILTETAYRSRDIATQTVLPSADTAAMLF